MTEIYDEVGYIKEVLEHGLSYRWTRDLNLLVKYFHNEGIKKSEVKDILKKKCQMYVEGYNPFTSYRTVNNIVDKTWNNTTPLREIKEVKISKEVLQWFLDLEKIEISNNKLNELKEYYGSYKISLRNKIFTFNRIKFIFTLYIWGLIQSQYLDYAWSIDVGRYSNRLKKDANLSLFKVTQECNLLYDLGMIKITNGGKNKNRKTILKFIEENDVFNKEYNNKDYITISGDDLYNCGYWLEKQKYGSFICQHCGKEFAHYNSSKAEKSRKYCKTCADILGNHKFDGDTKIIICEDCGKQVEVEKTDVKTTRCIDCYEKYRRKYKNENQRKHRQNNK